MVKRVFIVSGPESSGTRLLTKLFMYAGCVGDSGHKQRLDGFADGHSQDLGQLVRGMDKAVIRRSCPHDRQFPRLHDIARRFQQAGWQPMIVLCWRAWWFNCRSKDRAGHRRSMQEATGALRGELHHLFRQAEQADVPWFMADMSLAFVSPERFLKDLGFWTGLDFAAVLEKGVIRDADAKYK